MEGPISWLAIDEYATRRNVDDEQREDLLYHIPKMDKVFLDFYSEKHKKTIASKPSLSKGK